MLCMIYWSGRHPVHHITLHRTAQLPHRELYCAVLDYLSEFSKPSPYILSYIVCRSVLFVVLFRGCAYEEECLNRDTGRAYNGSTLKVSERERERESDSYIYVYIYVERERKIVIRRERV